VKWRKIGKKSKPLEILPFLAKFRHFKLFFDFLFIILQISINTLTFNPLKKNTNVMKIVFMGTPEFAVESLHVLAENGCKIAGVVTMPDKAAGRGHKIQYSAVKQYALEKNLPLLQPENLKDPVFLDHLRGWKADVQTVVAFRMLPEAVWAMPPHGTFNLHASLLPQYRGAAPINRAIMNGETETGITTFFLTGGMDTGNIILQEKVSIPARYNAGDLHDELMRKGAKLVLQTFKLIETGEVKTSPQAKIENPKTAPKIFKEDCKLDFSQKCGRLHNFVRGLSPYPAAYFDYEQNGSKCIMKVFETETEIAAHSHDTGTIIYGRKNMKIAVSDGFLHLKSVQYPGKRRMPIEEFLCGMRI
jgi:methionyl-tRNA formyltransferase